MAMQNKISRLLALPPELRKEIWDLLLAPDNVPCHRTHSNTSVTAISRSCISITYLDSRSKSHSHAHDQDDVTCECHLRHFYIPRRSKTLCPEILRTSKQVYLEALPSLYERRTFTADPNRLLVSLWDRCSEVWFLLDRFLRLLPEHVRLHIRSIKLPMILSTFEVYGARQAFYSIARQLPDLRTVELDFSPSAIREHWLDDNGMIQTGAQGLFEPDDGDETYFLGPVMAFADARIIVTAVDKQDLGSVIFDRIKPHIEMRVWRQLLPVRVKREQRRIARIKRALGALEYDEVATQSEEAVVRI